MKGWKAWTGFGGGLLSGLGMIACGVLSDPPDYRMVFQGFAICSASFGVMVGLGHKIEKLNNSVSPKK